MSWRVQSAWFTAGSVSCIMHVGCYFHHMVLSGVIVVPALSAQIALCSQIVVLVSTLLPTPTPSPFYFHFTLFHCVMEMASEDPVGSINWCGSWFIRRVLGF